MTFGAKYEEYFNSAMRHLDKASRDSMTDIMIASTHLKSAIQDLECCDDILKQVSITALERVMNK